MAQSPSTTPASDQIPLLQKFTYGLGAFTNNLLSGALGSMAIVLNLGLGMDPAVVGTILAGAHLIDAASDPIFGYLSDHTRSRWGRRRPYIVIGAILSGLVFAAMWQLSPQHSQHYYFWIFLSGTSLFYLAYSFFATPFVALGYEMTEDYTERTTIQGFSNLIGQIPWLLLSWSYAFMENKRLFSNNIEGARTLAVIIAFFAIVCGVLPGIFCQEPFYKIARAAHQASRHSADWMAGLWDHIVDFLKGFVFTLRNRYFLELAAATFLVFNGFTMISGLGPYVIIFYVFRGDQVAGSHYVGWFGTALSACTFFAIGVTTWLATRIGKKRAFIATTATALVGYVVKWFCYRPGHPILLFLPAPLLAFGLGGLFTTISAMIADVCDLDELHVGYRREGTFGAIYWLMVKLGTSVALAFSGHLINVTGFQQALGRHQSAHSMLMMRIFEIGVPILAYALAIAAMLPYDLDRARVKEIQGELEKRRGKVAR